MPRDADEQRTYLRASGYDDRAIERLIRTPDGPRYAGVGNAFWPEVIDWTARRIMRVESRRGREP